MPRFTKHLTESRARLRDAITAKAAAVADVAAVQLRIDRLASIVAGAEPARSALASHDASQAQRLAAWAADPAGTDAPKADGEQRSALVRDFDDAEAQAAAATAAMAELQGTARIAAEKASAAHKETWIASRLVLLDEAEATLPALIKAVESAFAAKRRVDAARQSILAELQSDDPAALEVFRALGDFDKRRQVAETIPFAPDTNEFFGEWRALAVGLLSSPEAAIGDAPVAPLPAYQRVEMPDAVVAAAQAAAAFPTTSVMRA